jgi:hypothetical protein
MSSIIGGAVLMGLEGLLELVIPKLVEIGAEHLETTDLEPIIRSIVPGERLDDFVVRFVKERLPQLVTSIKEHTGEDSIKKIIATIKD